MHTAESSTLHMCMCTVARMVYGCCTRFTSVLEGTGLCSWRSIRGRGCSVSRVPLFAWLVFSRFAPPTAQRRSALHYKWPPRGALQNKNKTGCALTEHSLKSHLAPRPSSPFPSPAHTTQGGLAQRALQRPSHKKPTALTFVSKDDGPPPLCCFASPGLLCLAGVLSSVQQIVL